MLLGDFPAVHLDISIALDQCKCRPGIRFRSTQATKYPSALPICTISPKGPKRSSGYGINEVVDFIWNLLFILRRYFLALYEKCPFALHGCKFEAPPSMPEALLLYPKEVPA